MCSTCIQSTLPFSKVRGLQVLDSSLINKAVEYQDQHINMLSKHRCYTSVAHINTQSLPCSFDEFSLMMSRYQFDTIAVSETWLKNNNSNTNKSMVSHQYGKIGSPKLEEVLVSTSKEICHSKYVTT